MNTESADYHCFRVDPAARWQAIAATLETDPRALPWALANAERWLAQGKLHPAPLLDWQRLLMQAQGDARHRATLVATLRAAPTDVTAEQMRSCSPFVGGPFSRPEESP